MLTCVWFWILLECYCQKKYDVRLGWWDRGNVFWLLGMELKSGVKSVHCLQTYFVICSSCCLYNCVAQRSGCSWILPSSECVVFYPGFCMAGANWVCSFPKGGPGYIYVRAGFKLPPHSGAGKLCCQALLKLTSWLFNTNQGTNCLIGNGWNFNKNYTQLAHQTDSWGQHTLSVCWDADKFLS